MATAQPAAGLCAKGLICCGDSDPLSEDYSGKCCDPANCEECVGILCVDNGLNKPTDSACGYDCECASGICTGFLCD